MLVLQKFGSVCGFVFPLVAFCCICVAIASYPAFSWFDNALSDLGVVSGVTAVFFNGGLFISGVMGFLFAAIGLFNFFKSSVIGKVGTTVFAVATIWLMTIGIFNESFMPTHFIVAVLFFISLPVALCVLTAALYLNGEVKLASFTLSSSFIAATPWILFLTLHYASNVAIPETISAIAASVWVIIISYKMFKTTNTRQ
ncbi:MAG: DUF998 domain-containing protein [Nitrososphaerota archaeon]|nr:DUF998 domain-containing protein [Nitrososphaerota archaeon]